MNLRSDNIRRVLIFFVCCVFCYVIFYNSLFLDRRHVSRLVPGRLLYLHSNVTLPAVAASGGSNASAAAGLDRPDQAAGQPATTTNHTERPAAQQTSKRTAAPTPVTTSKPTARASTGPAAGAGPLVGDMFEEGFRIPNVGLCPQKGQGLQLVILITSSPSHARQRKAIRMTWGNVALRRDVALAFFVGRTNDALQAAISAEQETYGDIVQGNFVDAYRNLTLKTASMLEWLETYCSGARMILKTDDDMFINTDNVLTFVKLHWNKEKTLFGKLARRWKPIRNSKSKYYLSPAAYPDKFLPDFMTGPAYILTGDLVSSLHRATLRASFLPLEDVLVTGVVGDQLKVKRVHGREFINDRIKIDTCKFQTAISVHMVKFEEQFDIWKRISDGRSRCARGYEPTTG